MVILTSYEIWFKMLEMHWNMVVDVKSSGYEKQGERKIEINISTVQSAICAMYLLIDVYTGGHISQFSSSESLFEWIFWPN